MRKAVALRGAFRPFAHDWPHYLWAMPHELMHLRPPRITSWPHRQLDIACAQGVPLAADGEYWGEAKHVSIHCQAARLQVVRH